MCWMSLFGNLAFNANPKNRQLPKSRIRLKIKIINNLLEVIQIERLDPLIVVKNPCFFDFYRLFRSGK